MMLQMTAVTSLISLHFLQIVSQGEFVQCEQFNQPSGHMLYIVREQGLKHQRTAR